MGGFITRSGECLLDVEPDEVAARYRRQAEDSGDGWLVPADPSFLTQWGVTDSELAAWVGPRLTDFPLRCQTEPTIFDQAPLARVRKAYVRHTGPPLASLERSYRRAVSDGWDCRDMAAGHDMMLEVPDLVADLLVELARPAEDPRGPAADGGRHGARGRRSDTDLNRYRQGSRTPVRSTLNMAPLKPRSSSAAQNWDVFRLYSALNTALWCS